MEEIIRKKTKDNWCGNFNGDEVEIIMSRGRFGYYIYCAGTDDYALVKDYNPQQRGEFEEMCNVIKSMDFVNQDELESIGFKNDSDI